MNSLVANAFLAQVKARYAPGTAYRHRRLLKEFLRALEQFGAPRIELAKIKPPQPRPNVASTEQIDRLLSQASAGMRLFVLLCWQCALRHSEAYAVTPRRWDPKAQTISIPVKGGKTRTLPVTSEIANLLDAAAKRGDPDESAACILHGRHLAKSSIGTAWLRLCKRAGVEGILPHDLRRTTLSQLYRTCGDLRAVQQFAGHDRLTSTVHYLAPLTEEKLRDLHRLLNFHSEVKQ